MSAAANKLIFEERQDTLGLVPSWVAQVPEVALPSLWATMRDFHLAEAAIPNRYKELIGVAVSGARDILKNISEEGRRAHV